METAVVASMSVAAAGTLAITSFSHLKACASDRFKKVRDLPVLHQEAFTHPVDHLIASQRNSAPLGARVNCKVGDLPTEKLYVVFNGEVLLAGPDANVEQVAYPLGGATVSCTGSTVSVQGKHIDKMSLTFTNEGEASVWVKELKRASGLSPPGKRIDELVADIFRQEKHIADLQEELNGCRGKYDDCCAEMKKKQKTEKEREKFIKELEEKLEAQEKKTNVQKQIAKKYKEKAKAVTPVSIDSSLTTIQELLVDLEGRGTPVPRSMPAVNGVANGVGDTDGLDLQEQLMKARMMHQESEQKNKMLERQVEDLMANEVQDCTAELDLYKSKAAELEAMNVHKDEELQKLSDALAQLEVHKVQLSEYQSILQEKERELSLLSSSPADDKQSELVMQFQNKIAQYEVALQQKELELEAALNSSSRDVQAPDMQADLVTVHPALQQKEQELQEALIASRDLQDEIVHLRAHASDYERAYEQRGQDIMQLQSQILQHEDALKVRQHEMEMLRSAPGEQQGELTQQLQNQVEKYQAIIADKEKELVDKMDEASNIRERESMALLQRAEGEAQRANALEREIQLVSAENQQWHQRNAELEAMVNEGSIRITDLEAQLVTTREASTQDRDVDVTPGFEAELIVQQEIARQASERAAELEAQMLDVQIALQEVTRGFEAERSNVQTANEQAASLKADLLQAQMAVQQERARADEAEANFKGVETLAQQRGQLAADLEAELEKVAKEGGVNQEATVSRALEAENRLDAMMQQHEQEKALQRDELTQKFERDLAQLRDEAARSEADARDASRQATLVAQEHAALASEREQDVQRATLVAQEHAALASEREKEVQLLSEQNQQLAQRNAGLEAMLQDVQKVTDEKNALANRVVQMEEQHSSFMKDYDSQLEELEGHRSQAGAHQQLHRDLADLKVQMARKSSEADEVSNKIALERNTAFTQLAEMESIYNQRIADMTRQMENMVKPEELLAVQQKLARSDARAGDAEVNLKQAEQDLLQTRQITNEKMQFLEAELATARERAAAGDQMAQHLVRLQSERDMLQQKLNQQSENMDKELQDVRAKLARCEDLGGSLAGATSPDVLQLEEENRSLKNQLAATWTQINEQTKKIEEERSSFWKELEMVRRRTATLATVANRPCEPVAIPPGSALSTIAAAAIVNRSSEPLTAPVTLGQSLSVSSAAPTTHIPISTKVFRSPGYSEATAGTGPSLKPHIGQRMQSDGDSRKHLVTTPVSIAVTQVPATSTFGGMSASPGAHSPQLMSNRTGASATMSVVSPCTTTPVVTGVSNLRPLSYDRVSNIRSFQPPYA